MEEDDRLDGQPTTPPEAEQPETDYVSDEDWAETETEVIEDFKKFARRASEWHHDLYVRMKEDRAFESGEQWGDGDRKCRGDGRAEEGINLCSVYVNAIVNPFQSKPFKFRAIPRDMRFARDTERLNAELSAFQNDYGVNEANALAFRDAVVGGLGFSYATVEEDTLSLPAEPPTDGAMPKRVRYFAVTDPTMVIIDPDARGTSLDEADRIAVVDFIPLDKAEEQFGEDLVAYGHADKARVADFGQDWEVPEDNVAVVTYFRRNGHDVQYFRLCGDHIVDLGRFEGLDKLPVFAFVGDRVWLGDKLSFGGVVRKVRTQQKTINYAQSQLIERMAKSPKGFFLAPMESIADYTEQYQNAEYGMSYILPYNLKDEDGSALPAPQFVNPQTHVEDLQGVMNAAIQQMSLAVGISPNGIVAQDLKDQSTATEVLLRTRSNQSNVSNYINHAKESIRIAGNVVAHLVCMAKGILLPKGSYDIVVEEGCVSLTKMEEDREKLLALAQIVPEQFKPLVAQQIVGKLDIEGSEQLAKLMWDNLPQQLRGGVPGWQEFQRMQQQNMMLQQQLQQLQQTNDTLNEQLTQLQLRTQTEVAMKRMDQAHDLKLRALDIAEKAGDKAAALKAEAEAEERKELKELRNRALDVADAERERDANLRAAEREKRLELAAEGERKAMELGARLAGKITGA